MIVLDGSFGEGGGQIVRTALAFSAISGLPFEVVGVRKGRCDSGLKSQHLACISALEQLSGSKAEGAFLGSERLAFYPGKLRAGELSLDVGTAGSVTLVLQSLLLPLVFGSSRKVRVVGGTDVPWSEPYDYFKAALVPQVAKFCSRIDVSLGRRGYFPKGGGIVDVHVVPKYRISDFPDFNAFLRFMRGSPLRIELFERGDLSVVRGVSHASSDLQKSQVAERQASAVKIALSSLGCPVRVDVSYSGSLSTGSGICLWAVFANSLGEVDLLNPVIIGSDALGEKRKRAEDIGREAASYLLKEISAGAAADRFMADQLLPFLALCGGRMRVSEVTRHCLTNIYVIEKFVGRVFDVDMEKGVISVQK